MNNISKVLTERKNNVRERRVDIERFQENIERLHCMHILDTGVLLGAQAKSTSLSLKSRTLGLPLPSLPHMLHAGLRCAGVRLDVTTMSFEAMDYCTPVFSALRADRHIWKAS